MTKKTYGLQIKGLHLGVYETEEELVRMLDNLPDELAKVWLDPTYEFTAWNNSKNSPGI